MKTVKITSKDLDKDNFYKEEEIGAWNAHAEANVEIEQNLGWVRFKKGVYVTGHVVAEAGSGIEAGWGIEAGEDIKAGLGIEAGSGIEAGWGIEAGEDIKAGLGIKAGSGIKAGEGIEAGEDIKAGWGIVAGLSITCVSTLSFSKRLFAGIALWRSKSDEEKIVACGKLEGGEICYGELIERGLPEEKKEEKSLSGMEVEVTIGDKVYKAKIV